eukprot:7051196-Prorocentrum_lima.AAC.1
MSPLGTKITTISPIWGVHDTCVFDPYLAAQTSALQQRSAPPSTFTLAPGLTLSAWVSEPVRSRVTQGEIK